MDDALAVASLSAASLDLRLAAAAAAPVVVAFSGGGDSLALLLGARRWAERAGRRLLAVTLDHRLQADSARWAAWCADRAAALGVAHQTLAWEGEKPATGLAAAARLARHRLLADAARAAGAVVILMGHTADDRLEARLMRRRGGSVLEPREWAPSPVWPQGRGVFLLRPLLSARRSEIRRRLAAAGETWIDDPANLDPRHPRVRARLDLAGEGADLDAAAPAIIRPAPALDAVSVEPAGEIVLARGAPHRRLLGPALLCAAGSDRPPRRDRLERLCDRIDAGETFTATLAGARIEADGATVRIGREAGELARAFDRCILLAPGAPLVWDGRFEAVAEVEGLGIRPLAGVARRLARAQRSRLADLRPAVRKALPAIVDAGGRVSSPILGEDARLALRSLVEARFRSACGAVECEADIETHGGNAPDTLNRWNECAMRRVDEPA